MTATTAYRARWIVPVNARPIENGVLVVAGDRIVSVADRWSDPVIDLGDVALIPGLVNCHTHLEFSDLEQPLEPRDRFTDWIHSVIGYRNQRGSSVSAAIQRGLAESVAGGVTLLGDIATTGWTWSDYATVSAGPSVVVFQELLGLTAERAATQAQLGAEHLQATTRPSQLTAGLSPHAPYSVRPDLFDAAVAQCDRYHAPFAMHLAETTAERELLRSADGPFRTFLESLGLWQPELFGGRDLRPWLEAISNLPQGLIVHGNDLHADELAVLARAPHLTLVYCPRTHAAFGHSRHPWLDLLNLGGSVAIGTDSRASNPDLSLWAELQFLAAEYPQVAPHEILQLGTLAGARAFGRSRHTGSLTAGKRADVAVIELAAPGFSDPNRHLLAVGNRVVGTMIGGQWAFRQPGFGG